MRRMLTHLGAALLLFATSASADPPAPGVVRNDFTVQGEPGIALFVREVRASNSDRIPILLVHGARVPGVASFDLEVPGGSLAADLARAGHPVYVMDIRGYGRSTRPAAMTEPPGNNPPVVRSRAAMRDIAAVVDWLRKRRPGQRVALLGWAIGGYWSGYYATVHPEHVEALIMLNTLYGGGDHHALAGRGSPLEDPDEPGQFNFGAVGAYRFSTAESLFGSWDQSIPVEDKTTWRDPRVAAAHAAAALASDTTSGQRSPPSFRSPNGVNEDSFYVATGRRLWDASMIRARTLVIASENDFWSRPADRQALRHDLEHAVGIKVVVIPDATHYVFLDRPERGRARFIREVLSFLAEE